MTSPTTTNTGSFISGQVSNVNDNGVQLDGGQWYNLSKFGTDGVQLPNRGASVTLRLDKGGFIRAIEQTGQAYRPQAQTNSAGTGSLQQPNNKDRSIVLQTIIKASADLAGSTDLGMADFPEIADTMLQWYESRITEPVNNPVGVEPTELGQLPF